MPQPRPMTFKQGSMLFGLTGRKFWEPAVNPPPTIEEASRLIDMIQRYLKSKDKAEGLLCVDAIRRWFPEYEVQEIHYRSRKRSPTPQEGRGQPREEGGPESEQDIPPSGGRPSSPMEQPESPEGSGEPPVPIPQEHPPEDAQPQEGPAPKKQQEKKGKKDGDEKEGEPKEAPKPKSPPKPEDDETAKQTLALIEAGMRNIFYVGPAGCGKTTIGKNLGKLWAEKLGQEEVPVTILSCSYGTSPHDITGYLYPEPKHSPVSAALGMPGIILFDEMVALDPAVAAVANAILANGEMQSSMGHVERHKDCVIIATANTFGRAGSRQYVSAQQLDAATLDRFAGNFIEVDYSTRYEEQFDEEVVLQAWKWREAANKSGLRVVVSTRSIINGSAMKKAGIKTWRERLSAAWTADEKKILMGA